MCGRFALFLTPELLADLFGLAMPPALVARYNIAPTQPVGLVRIDPQTKVRTWALAHWGLIPSWSKDPGMGARLINARAETVPEKPSFRAAFRRRRCIIPASGFYEWQQGAKGKQPQFILPAEGSAGGVFGFAGLWERWIGPDGSELESCTILTTDVNELMAPIHNRMPLILAPEDYADWLGTGKDDTSATLSLLQHLFRPYPPEAMRHYPVSTYVNSPRNEGEACVAPVE